MKSPFLFLIALMALWLGISGSVQAQAVTGTLRGQVLDADSKQPLAGATVEALRDSVVIGGGYTDEEGYFAVENIPVGRIAVRVSYLGYEPYMVGGLLITSGKELSVNAGLREQFMQTDVVEVTAEGDKKNALNSLATVSARSFNTEETNRYAGSLGDPARMASNFAGVASAGDTRNDIVVRGNSPLGLLWRLEGIDIPNPNHFSSQGANGGPVSIINSNMLANSDFFTGAFPAEYSNASAAAFDLKLRNGNNRKRETAFQMGFAGFELMTEGPISKANNSSYVLSARYSTLAAFDVMGITFGDLGGIPYFQDVSFKVNFPSTKLGRFSVFGVGGNSSIDILESELERKEFLENEKLAWQDIRQRTNMGVVGVQNAFFIDDKSYLQTTLSISRQQRKLSIDSLSSDQIGLPDYREQTAVNQGTLSLLYNRKLNARHSLRVGTFVDHYQFNYADSLRLHQLEQWFVNRDLEGNTQLIRPWAQWQWRLTTRLTLNTGLNALYLTLNDRAAVEPRAGLKLQLNDKSNLALGYGMHHQVQPWMIYFQQDAQRNTPNENLDFTRSQHLVLGYDWSPLRNFRIKAEAYVQDLTQVPVSAANPTFSVLNLGAGFDNLPRLSDLRNTGKGRNIGLELTLEKFLSKGNYFLITASVFNSEYTPYDGKTYNTAFNNHYVVNALAGVERPIGAKQKNALFADVKLTHSGGIRYTPVDLEASNAAGREVKDLTRPFEEQARSYFRADLTIGLRSSGKKLSQEFSMLLQNVTNTQNVLQLSYNRRIQSVVEYNQLGFFPIAQYKITF